MRNSCSMYRTTQSQSFQQLPSTARGVVAATATASTHHQQSQTQQKRPIYISDSIYDHNSNPYLQQAYQAFSARSRSTTSRCAPSVHTVATSQDAKFICSSIGSIASTSSLTPTRATASSTNVSAYLKQNASCSIQQNGQSKSPFFIQTAATAAQAQTLSQKLQQQQQHQQQLQESQANIHNISTQQSSQFSNINSEQQNNSTWLTSSMSLSKGISSSSHTTESLNRKGSPVRKRLNCGASINESMNRSRSRSNTGCQNEDSERILTDRILSQNNKLMNMLKPTTSKLTSSKTSSSNSNPIGHKVNSYYLPSIRVSQNSFSSNSGGAVNSSTNKSASNIGATKLLNSKQPFGIVDNIIESIMNSQEVKGIESTESIVALLSKSSGDNSEFINKSSTIMKNQQLLEGVLTRNITLEKENQFLLENQRVLEAEIAKHKQEMATQISIYEQEIGTQRNELTYLYEKYQSNAQIQLNQKQLLNGLLFFTIEAELSYQAIEKLLKDQIENVDLFTGINTIIERSHDHASKMLQHIYCQSELLSITDQPIQSIKEKIQLELESILVSIGTRVHEKKDFEEKGCQTELKTGFQEFFTMTSDSENFQNGSQTLKKQFISTTSQQNVQMPKRELITQQQHHQLQQQHGSNYVTAQSDYRSDQVFSSAPNPLEQISQESTPAEFGGSYFESIRQRIQCSEDTKEQNCSTQNKQQQQQAQQHFEAQSSSSQVINNPQKAQVSLKTTPFFIALNQEQINVQKIRDQRITLKQVDKEQDSNTNGDANDISTNTIMKGNKPDQNVEVDVMNLSPCLSTFRAADLDYSSMGYGLDTQEGVNSNKRVLIQTKHLSKASISYQPPMNTSHLSMTALSAFGIVCADQSFNEDHIVTTPIQDIRQFEEYSAESINQSQTSFASESRKQNQSQTQNIAASSECKQRQESSEKQPTENTENNEDVMTQSPTPVKDQVVACYSFKAQKENDLEFQAGDIIKVFKRTPNGWWIGYCNSKLGYFPSNFVKPHNSD